MVLFIDYDKFIDCDKSDLISRIQYLILEACLTDGIICFTGLTIDSKYKDSMEILLSKLYEYIKFFILTTDELNQGLLSFQSKRYIFTEIIFPELTQAQRLEYWLKSTAGQDLLQEELEKISRGFLLTKGKINNIVRAFEFSKSGNRDTDTEMLKNMCIDNSIYDFGFLATRVKKAFNWDDIILNENCKNRLADICNRVKYKDKVYDQWGFKEKSPYGNGISMLFYGPPGTGKTMAAQVMAKQIGCELYKVDLSQIVDKYIGETEKNLKKIFDNANRANVMLFFDEADSIFSKRTQVSNANDKYANVETSYLLQKMEEYEGICILATNFLVSFDDAFKRRIKFMVNFPMPDEKERLVIWQKAFPSGMRLSPDIQLQRLAEKYELTGSSIKSIVISSAFYAAANNEEISMKHIFLALKDELEKDGKVIIKREFDMY
jgi:AAA+ superfamily predicted ATPase